jgi:hypothetical protein
MQSANAFHQQIRQLERRPEWDFATHLAFPVASKIRGELIEPSVVVSAVLDG